MTLHIRPAQASDAADLLAIYAPYVRETTVTFEFDVPSVKEFAARIEQAQKRYAYLVLEKTDGDESKRRAVGYAYYGAFKSRPAYQWAAETSIYLAEKERGHGAGSILLSALESCMAAQGITNSEACITGENDSSVEFHRRHGYEERARFIKCANKFDRWLDVVWMEKYVGPHGENPQPIQPLDTLELMRIVDVANERLNKR